MYQIKYLFFILIILFLVYILHKNKEYFFNKNIDSDLLYKDPDIRLLKNFLSKEECDYIIKLGDPYIKRSEVCGKSGSTANKNRTSMTSHIGKKFITQEKKDKILWDVMLRASKYCKKPVQNIEHIQLVKYTKGQFFKPHYDYLDRNIIHYKNNIEKNGQREFTFFVYLTDVPENVGGTTYFPRINKHFVCKKGDSLFWSNMKDGKEDTRMLHGGTELLEGVKYGLNIWVREKEYIG